MRGAVEEDKEQDVSPLLSLRPTQVKNFVSGEKDADSQNSKKREIKASDKKAHKFNKVMAKIDVTTKAKSPIAQASPKQSDAAVEDAKPAPPSKQGDNPQQASRQISEDDSDENNDLGNDSFDNLEDGEGAQSDIFPIDEEFNLGNYT